MLWQPVHFVPVHTNLEIPDYSFQLLLSLVRPMYRVQGASFSLPYYYALLSVSQKQGKLDNYNKKRYPDKNGFMMSVYYLSLKMIVVRLIISVLFSTRLDLEQSVLSWRPYNYILEHYIFEI